MGVTERRHDTATHFNTLQHTVTFCYKLQYTATHHNTLQRMFISSTYHNCHAHGVTELRHHIATHCNTLRHTATHCNTHNTLLQTAIHCNTSQHTCNACAFLPFRISGTLMGVTALKKKDLESPMHTSVCMCVCMYVCMYVYMVGLHEGLDLLALQQIVTHCNTMRHAATLCHTLQHIATQSYMKFPRHTDEVIRYN